MALTQIDSNAIQPGAITQELIANTVTLGTAIPKIANVQIANSSWTVLDDTAVSLDGGYIIVNGEGFVSGCQVLIGTTPASSVTFVSNTQLRAVVAATTAGSYITYVVNPDGGTATRVNGLTYSATPTWVTGSSLESATTNTEYSYQLVATGATSYSLQAGSSLPSNATLAANGLLVGTTSVESNTNYSFTVVAIDDENQDSPRTFSFDIQVVPVEDPYWSSTSILLKSDGSNFYDATSKSSGITTVGNAQVSTSVVKYGPGSAYFDGSGGYLTASNTTDYNFGSGNFTIEFWIRHNSYLGWPGVMHHADSGTKNGWALQVSNNDGSTFILYGNSSSPSSLLSLSVGPMSINTWYHVAFVRSGSNFYAFKNGSLINTNTITWALPNSSAGLAIGTGYGISGGNFATAGAYNGYIEDVRITKGIARYTSNFTPPTSALSQYL